jgi:nicotinate-nucleotide adenylyltransferase
LRTLIFGGTFNPVHIGHLFIAEEARTLLGYGQVLFVPASIPVHKDPQPVLDPIHRLRMLALALDGHAPFLVEDCEIRRGGPSYAIDTVEELMARHGSPEKPGLLIGDDLTAGFASWRQAERLAGLVDLIVVRRSMGPVTGFPFPHRSVENPVLGVSSSDIRRRTAQGCSIRFLVPEGVREYIERFGLYA